MADDDGYGAYLFKGAAVEDVGDLDVEDDPSKEWARLSPDGASAPRPIRLE